MPYRADHHNSTEDRTYIIGWDNISMDFLPISSAAVSEDIRVLTADEIKTVEHHFTDRGVGLPDPQYSVFVGAVKDGRVLGFIVLQIKLHAEPMVIEEGHSDLFKPIVAKAEQTILERCGPSWVYLFAPAGRIAQLASTMGMQQEPWVVMSKLVMPPEPVKPITLEDMQQETGAVQ